MQYEYDLPLHIEAAWNKFGDAWKATFGFRVVLAYQLTAIAETIKDLPVNRGVDGRLSVRSFGKSLQRDSPDAISTSVGEIQYAGPWHTYRGSTYHLINPDGEPEGTAEPSAPCNHEMLKCVRCGAVGHAEHFKCA